MLKKTITSLLIFISMSSGIVFAENKPMCNVRFTLEKTEGLTEDVEVILKLEDNTCASITLTKENDYVCETVLPKMKAEIVEVIPEEVIIESTKELELTDYFDCKLDNKIEKTKDAETNELKENKCEKSDQGEGVVKVNFQDNLLSILDTVIYTCSALAILGIIFGIIMFVRR